jgi:hypothetical protein
MTGSKKFIKWKIYGDINPIKNRNKKSFYYSIKTMDKTNNEKRLVENFREFLTKINNEY